MLGVLKKLFDPNQWEIDKLKKHLVSINEYENAVSALSDEELKNKTPYFKKRLESGETLDDIMPEAFAACREAARRTVGLRPYDVQVQGAMVLHQGRMAEMKTGEGKTLVATMPTYLNALSGKGVHIITVNDYLAKRDARWMGPIYHFMGLSVGVIQHDQAYIYDPDYIVGDDRMDQLREVTRREAYRADITYGTNNEFGFDYLRDNLVMELDERVQRELNYAIIDEVDSILIDEARTPLIISGRGSRSSDNYRKFARIAARLQKDIHYTVDQKAHSTPLKEEGVEAVEKYLGLAPPSGEDEEHPLYSNENIELVHHLDVALKAKELYQKDDDYVIKEGEIVIVDEFTGRLMLGRRYSDGIHQAIEAKENVKVRSEDQTLASITFQNYFRMYKKLSGMTGTAATEEKEFREIYNTDVVIIPTNKNVVRQDLPDRIYKTEETKFESVIYEIDELHKLGRPVLVGTRSIEKSERLASMLKKKGIKHNVLNAKHHEKEAAIIAEAGLPGAVTIATNMAGRGVDIILGGAPPTTEREKRKLHSAEAHLTKITGELSQLKNKLTTAEEELAKLEERYKKALDARKENSSDDAKKLVDEIHLSLQEAKINKDDLKKALSGHQDMLPQLEEKVAKCREELQEAEKETARLMKEWAQNHEKVIKAGGLAIIGTERHESRRIDNQLRGRAGRQGDPGSTRFYTALEDELMRLFGSQNLPDWLTNWDDDPENPLEFGFFTKQITGAQAKVESFHFDIRKSVLEYDNVMNEQRKIIYAERDRILRGENLKPHMMDFIEGHIDKLVMLYAPADIPFEEWDLESLFEAVKETLTSLPFDASVKDIESTDRKAVREKLMEWFNEAYEKKENKLGEDLMRTLERWTLLQMVDTKWIDHLQTIEDLKEGVRLRAYGQKDPLVEFINESYEYFEAMKQSLQEETIKYLFRVQVKSEGLADAHQKKVQVTREHRGEGQENFQKIRQGPKVGRNDPCPCGSGKKYKKCCERKES